MNIPWWLKFIYHIDCIAIHENNCRCSSTVTAAGKIHSTVDHNSDKYSKIIRGKWCCHPFSRVTCDIGKQRLYPYTRVVCVLTSTPQSITIPVILWKKKISSSL